MEINKLAVTSKHDIGLVPSRRSTSPAFTHLYYLLAFTFSDKPQVLFLRDFLPHFENYFPVNTYERLKTRKKEVGRDSFSEDVYPFSSCTKPMGEWSEVFFIHCPTIEINSGYELSFILDPKHSRWPSALQDILKYMDDTFKKSEDFEHIINNPYKSSN